MPASNKSRTGQPLSPRWLLVLTFLASVGYVAFDRWKDERRVAHDLGKGESQVDVQASDPADSSDSPSSSSPAPSSPAPDGGSDDDSTSDGGVARSTSSAERTKTARANRTIVPNMTIRDQSGKVVYQGDIDLTETLARIERGERLSFPHDGTVFQNRERRLPRQPSNHYREWVHPTPRLSGPGPQRVVTGRSGEAYYTPDHYETFHKLRATVRTK